MTLTHASAGGAPAAPRTSEDVPAPAGGLQLLGEMQGSGHREAPSLVRRGDGQTVQLTRLLYLVLEAVDGARSYAEIASIVSGSSGRRVGPDDVRYLVESKLRPLGLLQRPDGTDPELKRSNPLLALRFRYVVADPDVTRRLTGPFAVLFHPVVVAPVLVAFVLVVGWTLFTKGLASATHQAFDEPGLLLVVFVITVLSAGFHEFGHAAAARYGGATPGAMGAGLYLVWPAFYTDVSDTYRLGRGGRLRTDLGGLYFNAIVALVIYGTWLAFGWDALLLVIVTQLLQMVRQLTPMVRFDGYHVLADLTGVPDLYQHIKPTLLGLLPTHWGDPRTRTLKPWARVVVTAWVLIFVPLLLAILALMIVALPRLVATAWHSLGERWSHLADDFVDLDLLAVLVDLLSIVGILVPLLGVAYILASVVRRTTRRVLRATEDRPVRRAAAGAIAFLLVGVLAYAWWPSNADYRPVQAWERGTLGDAASLVAGPSRSLGAGRGGSVNTVWPAGDEALPTRDSPQLAIVLVPADGSDDPAWVFPFNRPEPPDEGDNQALAVATSDGATVYDVAFALVWADGTVLNDNEAYAFASCADCQAVAVSFQVILAAGQVDVIVPENIAVAVNYGCMRCVTQALATQLVLTLPEGGLSQEANAALLALWEQIAEYGENIQDVPLSELQSDLQAFENQILEIVRQDLDPAAAAGGSTTTSSTTTTTESSGTSTVSTTTVTGSLSPALPVTSSSSSSTTSTSSTSTTSTTTTSPGTTTSGG